MLAILGLAVDAADHQGARRAGPTSPHRRLDLWAMAHGLDGSRLEVTDPRSFMPASQALADWKPGADFKKLNKVLTALPYIRTRKPSPQRLEIHAGDWARFRRFWEDASSQDDDDRMAEVRTNVERAKKGKWRELR